MKSPCPLFSLLALTSIAIGQDDDAGENSDPGRKENAEARGLGAAPKRVITHKIQSEYLGNAETAIHVLLPGKMEKGRRYPVLYVLPVIDGNAAWGQPFKIAEAENFADKYNVICAMATFPHGTLYVNHPTDTARQDESYFIKDVVPFVDSHYPTLAEARGRYLAGFCASGSGGMWMMLRHPAMFGKVAAWDAWLDLDHMIPADAEQFGTDEHYKKHAVRNLVDQHAHEFIGGPTRIVMMAYRNERDGVHAVHRFHDKLYDYGIPHVFEFHEAEEHRWDSGWLQRAVKYLFLEELPEGTGKTKEANRTERQMAALHRGARNRRRRIILHHDAALDLFKPGMEIANVVENVYAFARDPESQIDTVFLDIGGGAVCWPSKLLNPIADLQEWFAEGNDFLEPVVKGGHDRELEVFFSHRVNGIANLSPEPIKRQHPDWLIDWREDPAPPHSPTIPWDHASWQTGKKGKWGGDAALWNYSVPEVRKLQLDAIREVVTRYEIDGIQLDFVRHAPYLPIGKQWRNRDKLTEFLSSVRQMMREVELKKGKPILLGVKVADSIAGCHFDGIEIERWIRDQLVDLVAIGARSLDVKVSAFNALVGNSGVKIFPSHDRHHGSDGYSYPPLRYHRGVMANFWQQKPDGVMVFNFGAGHIAREERHDDSQGFREFGSPATLRTLDKTFVIQRRAGGHPWEFGHPEDGKFQPWTYANSNLLAPLPATLGHHGKALTYLTLNIADQVSDAEEYESARLRVLFSDPGSASLDADEKVPVGATKFRYGSNNFKVKPLAKETVPKLEVRLNNIRLGEAVVQPDGWLAWDVDKDALALGPNLLCIRAAGLPADRAGKILVECVEMDVDYKE